MAHGRASSILAFGTINNKAGSRMYSAVSGFLHMKRHPGKGYGKYKQLLYSFFGWDDLIVGMGAFFYLQ